MEKERIIDEVVGIFIRKWSYKDMINVITIPKQLSNKGDLVVVPRFEYEEYLNLKKIIPIIKAGLSEKKAISAGRKEIKTRQFLTLRQLKNELGC